MSEMKIDRASRSADTRAKTERRKPWTPPSRLDTPPAPEGYEYRWIRSEVNGFQDKQNVYSKLREGYELVRLEDVPEEYHHILPAHLPVARAHNLRAAWSRRFACLRNH